MSSEENSTDRSVQIRAGINAITLADLESARHDFSPRPAGATSFLEVEDTFVRKAILYIQCHMADLKRHTERLDHMMSEAVGVVDRRKIGEWLLSQSQPDAVTRAGQIKEMEEERDEMFGVIKAASSILKKEMNSRYPASKDYDGFHVHNDWSITECTHGRQGLGHLVVVVGNMDSFGGHGDDPHDHHGHRH